jgi:hypothetical protein
LRRKMGLSCRARLISRIWRNRSLFWWGKWKRWRSSYRIVIIRIAEMFRSGNSPTLIRSSIVIRLNSWRIILWNWRVKTYSLSRLILIVWKLKAILFNNQTSSFPNRCLMHANSWEGWLNKEFKNSQWRF